MADWAVELHPDVDAWFMKLVEEDRETADLVEQAKRYAEHLSTAEESERRG